MPYLEREIIVIDDEEMILELLSVQLERILQSIRSDLYTVMTFLESQKALKYLTERKVALILSDVSPSEKILPLDDFLRYLAYTDNADTPVVAITGQRFDEGEFACAAKEVLYKPFKREAMQMVLDKYLP